MKMLIWLLVLFMLLSCTHENLLEHLRNVPEDWDCPLENLPEISDEQCTLGHEEFDSSLCRFYRGGREFDGNGYIKVLRTMYPRDFPDRVINLFYLTTITANLGLERDEWRDLRKIIIYNSDHISRENFNAIGFYSFNDNIIAYTDDVYKERFRRYKGDNLIKDVVLMHEMLHHLQGKSGLGRTGHPEELFGLFGSRSLGELNAGSKSPMGTLEALATCMNNSEIPMQERCLEEKKVLNVEQAFFLNNLIYDE